MLMWLVVGWLFSWDGIICSYNFEEIIKIWIVGSKYIYLLCF